MDLISSAFNIYGTVSETDRQYRVQAKKLSYQLKKAKLLYETDKVKYVPQFMKENLQHKIQQANQHLQKIEAILNEGEISFKQKIKLSLPFNKTLAIVRTCIEELQKAQQDVNDYASFPGTQNNGKRFVEETSKQFKKQQTMDSVMLNYEDNDQVLQEVFMGPTVQEDAAIQFTKNKYVLVNIELCGSEKIIKFIKAINQDFLVSKNKIHIKFQKSQNKIEEIQLFSLGRMHFKPIYAKLKTVYPDIDRISKYNHFVIKLKRQKVSVKSSVNQGQIMQQKKQIVKPVNEGGDQFFSFPCTGEQMVVKQIQSIVLQRSEQKNVYISDATGEWNKMTQLEKQINIGQQVAPFIPINKVPQIPDLYFKIKFEFNE